MSPRLHEGTLADLRTLMGRPPKLRRGFTQNFQGVQPAAGTNYSFTVPSDYWRRIVSLTFSFTASSTAQPRNINLQFLDGSNNLFAQVPLIAGIVASESTLVTADISAIDAEVFGGAETAQGSATSPTAGQLVCQVASVPPGFYALNWNVGLEGTLTVGTDDNNFIVTISGVTQATSENVAAEGSYPQAQVELEISATATVSIKAKNAGTAASIYSADFSLAGNGPSFAHTRLPDLVLQPGWQMVINIPNIAAADQISAINMLTECYASDWASGTDAAEEERFFDWLSERLASE